MDTDALRWFQQVADGVSVTDVSSIERVSQSGVSRALARLEKEVGTPLLHRSGRSLRMTHAGVAFKRHVDAVLHELDDGLAGVEQLLDPGTGTVTLAFQGELGAWLVPELIAGFRARHPQVRFDLRPARDELVTSVGERGDVDLELTASRPVGSPWRWQRLLRQPLQLALPVGHPLVGRSGAALAEAADLPFVALPATSLLRRRLDELCTAAGFQPTVAFECSDLATVLGFVAAGLGIAVVPEVDDVAGTGVGSPPAATARRVPLTDAGATQDVGLVWAAERRLLPSAERFRRYVLQHAGTQH
ncbi:LysR family transcriptional regulator [Kineococcus sp. T13]|uniref:LysR family transcriptional regulator n=1 Tax=Kineococcus vitellinus TaxID=2696565 RepID=UPI00141320AF|nr:LysR family transcriptional regulator [Kineococcus vitellinus]NAZ76578.1 LysR family transcriptional regulator [Kineococcus vitellinus]